MKEFASLIEKLEEGLKAIEIPKNPANLYKPISYTLALGGKRLRPLLTLLAQRIFDKSSNLAITPALAVEVFHNFTLIHDDIMDKAPLRRGKPTVYKKWNTNVAILSGDVMMVQAYQLLQVLEPNLLAKTIPLFNKCAIEVCEGQQYDMDFETRDNVSESEYIEMIRLKTAVLLGFALEMGALIGGASEKEAKTLCKFGQKVGIGFQLKDDLLDVYGDKKTFGKQVGGDIISNKKTFLLIYALKMANTSQKKTLDEWITKVNFDETEKVNAVTELYNQIGVKEATEKEMNTYFDEAFELLEKIEGYDEGKEQLKLFTEKLIDRIN